MKKYAIISAVVFAVVVGGALYYSNFSDENTLVSEETSVLDPGSIEKFTQTKSQDLIVIVAPSIGDTYDDSFFAEIFMDVVDFDIAYANAVLGNDHVRILVDDETKGYFTNKVPDEILVSANVKHIWARDFGTINPKSPVLFRYTPATFEGDQLLADSLQDSFTEFIDEYDLSYAKTKYLLDGGNLVDSYAGRVVTTTRFLEDNNLSVEEGKAELKRLLDAEEVAILPPDEDVMAHSDGMVMFANADTVIINRYHEPLRTEVMNELRSSFEGIEIIEVEAAWDENQDNLSSACGININAAVTKDYIYMPHFGDKSSDMALETIRSHTQKTVISVPANKVCKLGGSVRCLTWQQHGDAADMFLDFHQ